LFAIPLTMFFLHEKPTRNALIGTVLTIVGIVLAL
jgi:drug/metabolite transporter (DMT)-like permease